MARPRDDCFPAVLADRAGHFVAVGGDDAAVGDVHRAHALPDADDDRKTGEEAEGLAGEARRAQTSWDDGERPHTRRRSAVPAARVTLLNVASPTGRHNCQRASAIAGPK